MHSDFGIPRILLGAPSYGVTKMLKEFRVRVLSGPASFGSWGPWGLVQFTVEARKLEHHSPHALKVKYKGS